MGFRRSDLQEAFFVPGAQAFRVWGYGTTDPLEEVLAPDYFALARGLLRPGDPPTGLALTALPAQDGAPAPIKRSRGRPPGSKTRKPPAVIPSATAS